MAETNKILLVEDDPHLAKGLRFNLEREGYEIFLVDNDFIICNALFT